MRKNICLTVAVWNQNATLALLNLYEAKTDMLDHPKKKSKIWEAIFIVLQDFAYIKYKKYMNINIS